MSLKTIYVKTTGSCNLNCDHCFTNGKTGDKTQFDPMLTAAWVKDFMSMHSGDVEYHLEIHGGEPFLVPISKLKAFSDEFLHLSNVSMCGNSNLVFKITDEILSYIKVYFDSRIGTSWDHWIRFDNEKQLTLWKNNVRFLRSEGVSVHLKVSVSKQLINMSPDWFLDQMEAIGVNDVALERITSGGNTEVNLNVFPCNEKQDNWYLELYKAYKARSCSFAITTLDTIEQKLKTNTVKVDTNCRNCEQNIATINSNGTIGVCPNVATKQNFATVNDSAEVFLKADGRIDEIVKELDFSEICVKCDVFDLCGGDCHRLPWQGYRCGGLKNTLRFLSGRSNFSNLIFKA